MGWGAVHAFFAFCFLFLRERLDGYGPGLCEICEEWVWLARLLEVGMERGGLLDGRFLFGTQGGGGMYVWIGDLWRGGAVWGYIFREGVEGGLGEKEGWGLWKSLWEERKVGRDSLCGQLSKLWKRFGSMACVAKLLGLCWICGAQGRFSLMGKFQPTLMGSSARRLAT